MSRRNAHFGAWTPIQPTATTTREMIAIVGTLPEGSGRHRARRAFGNFTERSEQVNGAPSYEKVGDEDIMMWRLTEDGRTNWLIGEEVGTDVCLMYKHAKRIEDATGTWQAGAPEAADDEDWVDVPDVRVMRVVPLPDEEDLEVVGERTREQRDAEGRKHAIDLDDDDAEAPRKRSKLRSKAGLETRVAKARSLCQEAVDARVHELLKPVLEDFAKGKIDGAELETRREAARQQAAAGHAPLTKLDQAFADYNAAVAARVKAEAAEDAAGAKLEAALAELERGQAGPSGVKVESSPVQWVC